MKMSCVITSVLVFFFVITTTPKRINEFHGYGTLSIYVADVPDKFVTGVYGKGPQETNLQYAHTSLGSLLSVEHEQWASKWQSATPWYIEQIKTSPLRTYDAASADIIFVPAILNQENPSEHVDFITEADQFLPYLTTKTHVMVLSHAPGWYNSTLLRHTNSENFVFAAWGHMTGLTGPVWTATNIVEYPAFSFVHWSRGSKHLRMKEQIFDAEAIEKLKTRLVVESFVVRGYPDRLAVFPDCEAAPDICTHFHFKSPSDATPVYEAFQSAWYVIHPRGDFITRNSLCDTLLAEAVPVFFQAEYIDNVPFPDVLNWTKIAVYIPESEIVGENKTNVIEKLAKEFNKGEVLSRIEYIHSIRHIFQYMQNPDHELIRWDHRSTIDPGDDAFTFTMKSVLRNICGRRLHAEKCGFVDRIFATQTRVMAKVSEMSHTM